MEILPLHYGHSDGHTDICYSSDGEKLISCGGDGDVRVWNGFEDNDPVQTCLGEFVLSVQHKNEHLLVATDNNNVQLLKYPSAVRDGILTRFTAPVNHIAAAPTHNWVALGSEDMTVKVIDITTKETKTFDASTGPVLSVSICSKANILSISSGDGKLRLYSIKDESLIKEIDVVPKTNSFLYAKSLCRADFDRKHEKYFAYPDKNNIVILSMSDWSEALKFSADSVDDDFSITSFSPCGNYLAAVSLKGDIVIWSLRSQSIVDSQKHSKEVAITSIAWDPKDNGELAFSDSEGYVGLIKNCTNIASFSSVVPQNDDVDDDLQVDDDKIDFGDIQIEQSDDEDNENAISLDKLKNNIMGVADLDNDDEKSSIRSRSPRPRTPEIPLQPPFMPSSTPEHLDPRYMCWNEVGVVRCYGSSLHADDDGTKSIEVEFHDSSIHSSMMMANYQDYTMGSISLGALAVANATMINVVPLATSSKEWHLNLTEDQEIICIATSQHLVCFGLANNIVHVCSIFGMQKGLFIAPGPIVSMSACGHVVMVAYHSGSVRKNDQCIEIMLVKCQGVAVENHYIKSALTPEAKIQWIGFSDVGTPAMMDSSGMVYLFPLQSNLWIPYCDTMKDILSPIDGYFTTAIYESYGTVRGIRCKGSMYPGFTPRPTVGELEILPPFVELGTEKSMLEAKLFAWSSLQIENTDKKYKETALKTFALAAKNNLDQRALEFIEVLGNSQILSLAVKYAGKLNKQRLCDKLMDLALKLQDDNIEEPEKELVVSTPTTNVVKPNRKLLLSSSSKIIAKRKGLISTPKIVSTPSTSSIPENHEVDSTPSTSKTLSSLTPQSLSILEDEPKNPFLKSLKKPTATVYNPLSLRDKFAGIDVEKEKEKENKINNESAEKRKKPDSDTPGDKGKEKQRKLDRFMFSKKTT